MTDKKITFKKDLIPPYDYSNPKVGDCFRHRKAGTIYMVMKTSIVDSAQPLFVLVSISSGLSYGDAEPDTRDLFYGNKELFVPLANVEVIAD
jgi:hypothetical protein